MCQEIDLSEVRLALLGYWEERGKDGEHLPPDELLVQFDGSWGGGVADALDDSRTEAGVG